MALRLFLRASSADAANFSLLSAVALFSLYYPKTTRRGSDWAAWACLSGKIGKMAQFGTDNELLATLHRENIMMAICQPGLTLISRGYGWKITLGWGYWDKKTHFSWIFHRIWQYAHVCSKSFSLSHTFSEVDMISQRARFWLWLMTAKWWDWWCVPPGWTIANQFRLPQHV